MKGNPLPNSMDDLRTRVEEYRRHATRKILYDVALEKREKGKEEGDEKLVRDAIKIVLLGWNWRAYARVSISNDELNEQIEEFLDRTLPLRRYLKEKDARLETIDFGQQMGAKTLEQWIIDEFNYLKEYKGVRTIGASKMLHMFYPSVFMMWDGDIITAYDKKKTGKGYFSFLKDHQGFIKRNVDALHKLYPDENHVKIMDEYNFAAHSLDTETEKEEL